MSTRPQHLTVAQARARAVNRARRFMRFGLRSRIAIAFALGAAMLSVLLSVVTYGLVGVAVCGDEVDRYVIVGGELKEVGDPSGGRSGGATYTQAR